MKSKKASMKGITKTRPAGATRTNNPKRKPGMSPARKHAKVGVKKLGYKN